MTRTMILAKLKPAAKRIYNSIKKHPIRWGLGAIALLFFKYLWVLSPWIEGKPTQQYTDFVISIFTESIIIAITVMVVKVFIDKREEENRDPVYQSVFEDAYRIYEEIYRLAYTMMDESLFRGKFHPRILKELEYHELAKLDLHPVLVEFVRESDRHTIGMDRFRFLEHLRHLYQEVDDFLQYYGAFLTSDATEEAGSRLLTVFKNIRNTLRELQRYTDGATMPLHDVLRTVEEVVPDGQAGHEGPGTGTHPETFLKFKCPEDSEKKPTCVVIDRAHNGSEISRHEVEFHVFDNLPESESFRPWIDALVDFCSGISSTDRREALKKKYFVDNTKNLKFCTLARLSEVVSDDAVPVLDAVVGGDSSTSSPIAFHGTLARFFGLFGETDADSSNYLGILFHDARNEDPDDEDVDDMQYLQEAAKWFRKAADLEHPDGLYNLGLMYRRGRGFERNDAYAAELVTTRASYRWRARRVRSEWLPAGCSPGWPWTGDSSIFGSRHRRTCGCGSIRRLSA